MALDAYMTDELARYVRQLRVDRDLSWGQVAREVAARYPILPLTRGQHLLLPNVPGELLPMFKTGHDAPGARLDGMLLCDAAMRHLGEVWE